MRKFRNIAALFLTLSLLFALVSCGERGGRGESEQRQETRSEATKSEKKESDSVSDTIYRSIMNYETDITLKNTSEEEMIEAIDRILAEHPEIFWLDSYYNWTTFSGTKSYIELHLHALCSMDEVVSMQKELNSVISELISPFTRETPDYEKVLYLHDALVRTTEYDEDAFDYHTKHPDDKLNPHSYSAYGCLVEHKAVCAGYAQAFQLLLNKLGVECGRVSGANHEWNYVKLDGEYYYVDVTWDDPVASGGEASDPEYVSHEYFCVTTEELLADHSIESDNVFVPQCTAKDYDYFVYNGLYLREYSQSAVEEILRAHIDEGEVQMKFASERELNTALQRLFEEDEIFEMPFVQGTYTYVSYSYGARTLSIELS